MNKNYPYQKVLFCFTLIPAAVGIFWGVAAGIDSFYKAHSALFFIQLLFSFAMIFALGGFVFFVIPAFFSACIYILLKLHRTWYSYIFTTFVGGCSARIWAAMVFEKNTPWYQFDFIDINFMTGAVFSLMFSFVFLPKKPSTKVNVDS